MINSSLSELNIDFNNRVGNKFVSSSLITNLKVLDTGIYLINNFDNGITDAPIGGFGAIIVSKADNYYAYQAYISYGVGIYIRNCANGNWNDWKLIASS